MPNNIFQKWVQIVLTLRWSEAPLLRNNRFQQWELSDPIVTDYVTGYFRNFAAFALTQWSRIHFWKESSCIVRSAERKWKNVSNRQVLYVKFNKKCYRLTVKDEFGHATVNGPKIYTFKKRKQFSWSPVDQFYWFLKRNIQTRLHNLDTNLKIKS